MTTTAEQIPPLGQDSGSDGTHNKVPYEILRSPSGVIKTYERVVSIDDTQYQLVLITMSRSFLLSINDLTTGEDLYPSLPKRSIPANEGDCNKIQLAQHELIRYFMEAHPNMNGLSLAIGEHSTCLIDSANSLASSTLATRLSKKFNLNRPVYVANNIQVPRNLIDISEFMSKFYMKVFQFVNTHYKANTTSDVESNRSRQEDDK